MDGLLGWLLALLVFTVLVLWLVFFPEVRVAAWRHTARRGAAAAARAREALRHSARALRATSGEARGNAAELSRQVRRHWLLLSSLLIVLLLPPALVLGLHRHAMLAGYDMSATLDPGTTELVASLLKGEQLVPPPPLPPAVFTTPEVEKLRPHLNTANRKWAQLNPEFRQRLLAVFKIMQERYGYDMVLIEGYRSPQRQALLQAEGSNVTQAGPGQSYHQYGLAADCAFYRDGKLVISEKDPWAMRGYQLYGKVAQAAGLVWGGNWKMMDLGHTELHLAGVGPHAARNRDAGKE